MGCDYYIFTELDILINTTNSAATTNNANIINNTDTTNNADNVDIINNADNIYSTEKYSILIKEDKGYFYGGYEFDSDDDDYRDKLQKKYDKQMLESIKPDKVIYKNGKYINNTCKEKYDNIVKAHINKLIKNFSNLNNIASVPNILDIISITKTMSTYER